MRVSQISKIFCYHYQKKAMKILWLNRLMSMLDTQSWGIGKWSHPEGSHSFTAGRKMWLPHLYVLDPWETVFRWAVHLSGSQSTGGLLSPDKPSPHCLLSRKHWECFPPHYPSSPPPVNLANILYMLRKHQCQNNEQWFNNCERQMRFCVFSSYIYMCWLTLWLF